MRDTKDVRQDFLCRAKLRNLRPAGWRRTARAKMALRARKARGLEVA